MLTISFTARLLLFMSTIIIPTLTANAEVLSPPDKIPFAKDVIIKKYSYGNPLGLFKSTGKWITKKDDKQIFFIGQADNKKAYLLSVDKLTNNMSFEFDYTINDYNKEYGFIYGKIGVIVINNKIYPAAFDINTMELKATSNIGKYIVNKVLGEINTLEISTGYDPTGDNKQVCTIFVNGTGLTFDKPDNNESFGAFVGLENGITITNMRWNIGSI